MLACLHRFSREDLLINHMRDNLCTKKGGPVKCIYPTGGDDAEVCFKNVCKQLRVPFVIYADYECLTTEYNKMRADMDDTIQPNTQYYQKHIASSVGLKVVSEFENEIYYKPEITRNDTDVTSYFLNRLFEIEKEIDELMHRDKPLVMTKQDQFIHETTNECHTCNRPFSGGDKKVRDHCHITGKYRGPAHNSCNLNYKINKDYKIPVLIHNSKGYDTHLIMQGIAQFGVKRVECIPKTEEKYTCFSIGRLRFLDSMAFMNSSLSKLVDNLAEINVKEGKTKPNITNFPILMKHFKDVPLKDVQLLIRKGVYPYDFMNCKERFNDTQLPPKESFYSTLSGQHISDADYMHAINVWKTFNIKNMGEYNDLYLLTDVLLLADVFESFRTMCLKYYSLDPCHYVTLPSLAWDASLRLHNQTLELFTG